MCFAFRGRLVPLPVKFSGGRCGGWDESVPCLAEFNFSVHVLIRHLTGKCTGTSLSKAQDYLCRQEEHLLKDILLSNFLACGKKTWAFEQGIC